MGDWWMTSIETFFPVCPSSRAIMDGISKRKGTVASATYPPPPPVRCSSPISLSGAFRGWRPRPRQLSIGTRRRRWSSPPLQVAQPLTFVFCLIGVVLRSFSLSWVLKDPTNCVSPDDGGKTTFFSIIMALYCSPWRKVRFWCSIWL